MIKLSSEKTLLRLAAVIVLIAVSLTLYILTSKLPSVSIANNTNYLEGAVLGAAYTEYRTETLVEKTFQSMTHEERVGQLFMLSIPRGIVTSEVEELLTEYHIGGIVLMGVNIKTKTQTAELTKELQELADIPLLLSIDQEGGVVARIPWDEARFISQPHIGTVGREDFAYETGAEHAKALNAFNINMNLSPVLDIAFPSGSIMASRSFGSSPQEVATLGVGVIKGHQAFDVITTAKHFPGIGRTPVDSHDALPVINISKETLMNEEIVPFKAAIDNGVEVVMVGHTLYPQIDKDNPSTLSKVIITDILKSELGFKGIVLSDALNMSALDKYPNKIYDAHNAGNDMLLTIGSPEEHMQNIEKLAEEIDEESPQLEEAVKRILRIKAINLY